MPEHVVRRAFLNAELKRLARDGREEIIVIRPQEPDSWVIATRVVDAKTETR